MSTKTYKWTVEIEVDPVIVGDGFDLGAFCKRYEQSPGVATSEALIDMGEVLQYWKPGQATARVLSAPRPQDIRVEQGYPRGIGS